MAQKYNNFSNLSSLKPYQADSWRRYCQSKELIKNPKERPTVAYAGTSGSYTEDATINYFGEDSLRVACRNFIDIFRSISAGLCDYGVVPIENSTTGSVKDIFEYLDSYNCYIVGETQVRIDHCLMGHPEANLDDITDVFSHEQSLMQCSVYLEEHPNWKQHTFDNNALAAQYIKEANNKNFGAIASERAAAVHGLKILDKHINFLDINTTRFIILADHPEENQANKISLSFSVDHKPGALVKVLNIFDQYQLNLCKIESRPSQRKNWEYKFFIDIEGDYNESILDQAIKEVIENTIDFHYLGSYHSNID